MFNEVILIGRIGRLDVWPVSESGRQQTRVRVATVRKWRDLAGALHDKTTWHSVVGWEANAALLAEVQVGDTVFIEGYIDNDDSGPTFHSSVVAQKVLRLGGKVAELEMQRWAEQIAGMDAVTRNRLLALLQAPAH